jgi:sterol 14-demethylase
MNQQLKFVKAGVTQDMLASYISKVVEETEMFFEKLEKLGEFDIVQAFGELTILTAARCLLGPEIRNELHAEFADYYHHLNLGMTHLGVFWPHAPTEAHAIRDKARANIVTMFKKVITKRRASADSSKKNEDYLQMLMDATYLDGTSPTDDEICGLLLATLFAGQHTSSITSVWLVLFILSDKGNLLSRLADEQKLVFTKNNGNFSFDAMSQMELLYFCINEALRMYPPLILLMRYVQEPRTYKGYTIPKGEILMVSPAINQRSPTIFKNPDVYDPDRFAPPRSEGDISKYNWIPFGGGRHSCLGEKFATVQLKAIASVLIRKYNMEMLDEFPKPDYSALVVGPLPPCRVRLTKKPASVAAELSGVTKLHSEA